MEVSDLAVARGGVPVLDKVAFRLDPGEVLVLRGANGSGKTTLLRTLAGLQPPLSGRIGADPDQIAYAGHADGIKPTLSVAENLRFWAEIFGHREIERALADFDLAALTGRLAQNLSAGQKRRLGLARLLVTGRPIWLLDEPTVSLDAASVAMFARVMRAHAEGGGMAVIATHIELGLEAQVLDITPFRAVAAQSGTFDEAFL